MECVYIYIYIYIYREREREREFNILFFKARELLMRLHSFEALCKRSPNPLIIKNGKIIFSKPLSNYHVINWDDDEKVKISFLFLFFLQTLIHSKANFYRHVISIT